MNANHCLACGKPLRGRIDKKFCDDSCRNVYNNKKYEKPNGLVRRINHVLRRNRLILEKVVPPGEQMRKIQRNHLLEQGFRFSYFTNTYTTKQGVVYQYCYDHGWLMLERDWCLVVRSVDTTSGREEPAGVTPSPVKE